MNVFKMPIVKDTKTKKKESLKKEKKILPMSDDFWTPIREK